MSEMVKYFKGEAARAIARARAISDAADEEGRVLTDDEKVEVASKLHEAEDYKSKAAEAAKDSDLRETLKVLGATSLNAGDPADVGEPTSIGEAFIRTEAFKALGVKAKAGSLPSSFRTDPIQVPESVIRRQKATASPVLFGNGADDGTVGTQGPLSEGTFVRLPLVMSDLIPAVTITSGNSVTFPVVKDVDGLTSFSSTPEGSSKFEVKYEFDSQTETLFKLAAYTKMSSELLEDAPAVASYINADIPLQIRYAEDAYLWDALTSASGVSSPSAGDNDIDTIINGIAELAENGFTASAVVMSPTKLASLKTLKTESGGPYLLPPDLGVRVVVSPVADSILIGAFDRGAKVYRKGGLSVESTNANEDDFNHNLVTIRAEMRLVCGVTYPKAFMVI